MHLTSDELLDLAEGTRPIASAPHLATCEACRRQLDDLRGVVAALDVDVPEPSPLFWDHFSARVAEAVSHERAPGRSWPRLGRWSWGVAALMSAAAVALAVSLTLRAPAPPPVSSTPPPIVDEPLADIGSTASADDPSFMLLGDLAGSLDWDGAAEAGIVMDVGAADNAVAELSDAERTELQRLLREAIGPSGV